MNNYHSITIVDYGLGNIKAFYNLYSKLGVSVNVASSYHEIKNSKKLILPGVGSFDWAMKKINNSGLRDVLDKQVLHFNKPILGICSGMQVMADRSEEGKSLGLSWIKGEVLKISTESKKTILPHMGWNKVTCKTNEKLFMDLGDSYFYFLHSYYLLTSNQNETTSFTNYGKKITSSIKRKNIFGVQFHPEKSHLAGIKILKNFLEV